MRVDTRRLHFFDLDSEAAIESEPDGVAPNNAAERLKT
jgi:hypothetical protein